MPENNFNLAAIDAPRTLKDLAYEAIKEAILTGIIKPDELFSEPSLSAMLRISRTPTREALKDLAGEGFVRAIPKRGYKIKSLMLEDVEHLYDFRIPIELAIIEQVSGKFGPSDLEGLEKNIRLDRLAVESADLKSFVRNNRDFHLCLARITKNKYFIDSVNKILEFTEWAALNIPKRDDQLSRAVMEHENIYLALKRGDIEDAYKKMETHLLVSKDLALQSVISADLIDREK